MSVWSDKKTTKYENAAGTASLLEAVGRNPSRYGRIADRMETGGLPGSTPTGYPDFSGEFSMTDANRFIQQYAMGRRQRARDRGGDVDQAGDRAWQTLRQDVMQLQAENEKKANEKRWDEQYGPVHDKAAGILDNLASTSAVSASQEADLRSRMAGQVQSAKMANLSNVGAALGLRGVSNSPAAAALAARESERYDSELISQLRDAGIQVTEANRNQARSDAAAMTSLAQLRQNSKMAYMAHDVDKLDALERGTSELVAALYNRDKTYALMQQQLDAAEEGGGMGSAIGGALGTAAGAYFGGPMGAQIGGSLGSSIGGAIDGSGGGGGSQLGGSVAQLMMQQQAMNQRSYGYTPGNGYNGTVNQVSLPQYDANGYSRY